MYLNFKTKFKKLAIIFLSIVMLIALAFATACSDNSSSKNTETEETKTEETIIDYQLVKNGDFEFNTKKDSTYPYNTSINWTKSYDYNKTQADQSKGLSGIIDTADDSFEKLTENNRPTENPYTPYYYGLVENNYFYNADSEKRFNPNTAGTKVLMINNTTSDKEGSAQKFKSSSTLSIPADKYAKISVWVKTIGVSSLSKDKVGAYIKLEDKVNSTSYSGVYLDNINTNGEWALFNVYIKGSNIATTSLTLTLGLGKGNGISKQDYVEGYAFFDNVNFKTYTKTEYEALTNKGSSTSVSKEDLTYIDCKDITDYTDNGNKAENHDSVSNNFKTVSYELDYTTNISTSGQSIISGSINYNTHLINNTVDDIETGRIAGVSTLSSMSSEHKQSFGSNFDDVAKIGDTNPSLIYMNFEKGKASSATFKSQNVTIGGGKYQFISFYAKVDATFNNSSKAFVQILDADAKEVSSKYLSAFTSFETTFDDKNNNYGDWVKYSIIINNPTNDSVNYNVLISFGETGKYIEDYYSLQEGYALIANLSVSDTTEELVKDISYTNNKKITVYGDKLNYSDNDDNNDKTDSYNVVLDKNGEFVISKAPYQYISGFTFKGDSQKVNYGIINSKYINGTKYGENVEIEGLDTFKTELKKQGNEYAQAIVLNNKELTNSSFITPKYTLQANTFNKITLKVRVVGDAKATVYLLTSNLDDNNNFKPHALSIGDKTYEMKAVVDKNSHLIDGWTEICFYIATGKTAMDYRLQVFNGDMYGDGSKGAVYLETPNTTGTLTDENEFDADKYAYKSEYSSLGGNNVFTSLDHTRESSILKETVDGEVVESTITYQPTEVYAGNDIVKFFKFTTIDVDNVIDKTSSTDSETETEEDEGYTLSEDFALQISSIILTAVLILVILVMLFRNSIKKKRRTQEKVASFYDRNTREKTMKKIADKKQRVIDVDLDEEQTEYDYEEAQNIGEEIEEEVIDELSENQNTEESVIDVMELQKTEELEQNDTSNKTE